MSICLSLSRIAVRALPARRAAAIRFAALIPAERHFVERWRTCPRVVAFVTYLQQAPTIEFYGIDSAQKGSKC
jgi:hypothetical protein